MEFPWSKNTINISLIITITRSDEYYCALKLLLESLQYGLGVEVVSGRIIFLFYNLWFDF